MPKTIQSFYLSVLQFFINFSLFWEDFRTALFVTNNGFEWIIRSLISRRPVNKF